ncbi:hypothetical protein FQZ97_1048600 [compost metagenome]
MQQAAGQLQASLAVVADHRAKALWVAHAVDRYHRQPRVQQLPQAVVIVRQAAGDYQRVAAPRAEQLEQLPLAVRLIVRTGDQ